MSVTVNIDNFKRAESDAMISNMLPTIGGLGVFFHNRVLEPLSRQPIIRQNRDTLYSAAIVDIRNDAHITIPDVGDRYVSVMIVNQDHYVNRVFHAAGTYTLSQIEFETDYVVIAARILFDPTSKEDLEAVHQLQDALILEVGPQTPFESDDFDRSSHQDVRSALLTLGRTMSGLAQCFGNEQEVDPVRHLVGTAVGWGGLPDAEASYINIEPELPVGRYTMTFEDVPVDAFWSLSVYNSDGYFEPGPDELTNVNSVFAEKNSDGTTTIHLGPWEPGTPNRIDLPEGWNYMIRLYRPRLAELTTWTPPAVVAA